MSIPSTHPHIDSSTLRARLRSAGLLVLFVAAYFAVLGGVMAIAPARGMVWDTLIVLAVAVAVGSLLLVFGERRPWHHLGLALRTHTPREILAGLLIPSAALLLVIGFLALTRGVVYGRDSGTVSGWLAGTAQLLLVLAIPAAAEEAL